ncbi:flagellar biosynthesis protein FlhF [Planomicrobium sp. CPCC 101110]|uniref:flagellar biosynthesis protein FlhF n=1 Tax=Planomicrobium sp. CPCC 101110 TaxID=2599619 RepID=UPI0011B772E4|nr:flagellar biosynthesis protein FlhF [Planomicrobium sp. CPCC 101110]TWT27839.1 flagellar biosynthesis protein FlhF [Planomicrobium sp. CPCC 101110]
MRLKTYIVQNMTEAIPMIKRDLGSDALILNTKKIKTGGFLGFFKKEKLEVIAAVETKQLEQKKQAKERKSEIPPLKKQKPAEEAGLAEKAGKHSKEEPNVDMMNELKNIKHVMMQVIGENRLPETLKPLNRRLTQQEIAPEIQSELYAKLMLALDRQPDLAEKGLKGLARNEIMALVKKHQKKLVDKDPDIICFIGPTGVGKTTTIAKIAADLMLRADKKVGLITSDTYRIAAVEQLKTYASILNIPVQVAESSADVLKAIDELDGCDIILMDTAGRNYQQKQYIDDLEAMLPDKNKIQINLVLSLTSKYEDMRKIIDNFQTIQMDQLLLTKKDETSSAGAILNLIYHYSIPIHHIANGQNVPDDILTVTPELIANFVLGEDENG